VTEETVESILHQDALTMLEIPDPRLDS